MVARRLVSATRRMRGATSRSARAVVSIEFVVGIFQLLGGRPGAGEGELENPLPEPELSERRMQLTPTGIIGLSTAGGNI